MSDVHETVSGEEPRVTTVVETALKASVEPYARKPVVEIADGEIACAFCGNNRFRRSRFRAFDLPELLMLRLPMRCMRCNQRQYGMILTAALAVAPKTQGVRVARGKETWQAWTEQENSADKMQRPMTTAAGPRANKLRMPEEPAAQKLNAPLRWKDDDRQIW